MKHIAPLVILLLLSTTAFAKGECKDDAQKFCKDVVDDKGKLIACMNEHEAELSDACKAKREAKIKQKRNSEESGNIDKEGTPEPSHGSASEK
jgi:hypothetical protein